MAYSRTNWVNGDQITAAKLNNLEAGVVAALPQKGGFEAGEAAVTANYRFTSLSGADGIIRVNSGSGEAGIGYQTAGTKYWTIGKGCGGTENAFAVYCNQTDHLGNKLVIKPTGEVCVNGLLQLGDTSAQNVYAKFVANASGKYFGWHASADYFYLHSQNADGSVIGEHVQVDGSGNLRLNKAGGYTEVLSNNVGIRTNYNEGSPSVTPVSAGAGANNVVDLGASLFRYKSIFLVNSPNVSSDERSKKDVTEIDNATAAAFIDALKVVSYNYNDDKDDQNPRIGVIAQRLVEVNPDFAAYFVDDDGSDDHYLSLRPSDLVFPLIQAVQTLSAEVTALKAGATS